MNLKCQKKKLSTTNINDMINIVFKTCIFENYICQLYGIINSELEKTTDTSTK